MADPQPLPLVEPLSARYQSLTVDAKLINAIAEKGEGEREFHIYRRPAFKLSTSLVAGGVARGLFNWRNDIYAVVDGTLYKNGVSLGAVANAGSYNFSASLGAIPRLFLQNGTNAFVVTTGGVISAVTNPNYPAAVVGGTSYLDGTTYVMDAKGNIFGSTAAANDPTVWDPLNLIVAQIEPTSAIHLAKNLVYILALKQWYTEAFYDAGNPTGSPLAAVQGAKMNFGCVDSRTVRDVGGDLMWVSDSGEGFPTVVMVSSLKVEVVSTPPIERILATGIPGSYSSWNARVEGHRLYGVTSSAANFTLVYDLTSRIWYQWTDSAGNFLPYVYSCQGSGPTVNFLHATNGSIYTLDLGTFVDGAEPPFAMTIFTPNYDGGTRRTKTLGRMDFLGDQVATTINVAWSDDDFQTWSANYPVDMSLDRPAVADLGAFTKRAFRITHQANAAFRLKAAEMYLDVGQA